MSWFETGYDGADREKVEREKRRKVPWRFFLKVGQSARIVFLDDFTKQRLIELPSGETVKRPMVPVCFHEHNLTIDGDWKNWVTCLKRGDPPCPICQAGHYQYYVGMMTILAEWTDNDGVSHWSKRLLAAKIDAIEKIRRRQSKVEDGQLQFCMFEVARTSDRSVVTGDDYDFVKKLTRAEAEALLPKPAEGQEQLTVEPYDYEALFAPMPKAKLEELLKSGRVQPPRKRTSRVSGEMENRPKTVSAPSGGDGASPADSIEF